MNSKYAQGRNFEYKVANLLKKEGFLFVSRFPGSKHFDIVAWDGKYLFLIECKKGNYSEKEINKKKDEALSVNAIFRFYYIDEFGKVCMREVRGETK